MKCRMLTSALVLLGATAAAKSAAAATNKMVTSAAAGHISDSAGEEWIEDTKWGEMGAYFDTGYDLSSNYDGSSKHEKVSGELGAILFNQDVPLAGTSVKVHAGKSNTLLGDYKMSLFGLDVIDFEDVDLSAATSQSVEVEIVDVDLGPVGVSANGNFALNAIAVDVTAGAEQEIVFMGIPMVFTAGVAGVVGLEVSAEASYASGSGVSSIDFTGEPFGELNLVGSAGIGTKAASVGVYGQVTLLHVGVPVTNSLTLTPVDSTTGIMNYSTSGYLSVSSLSGEIGVYLKIWPVTYKYSVFDWDGIEWYNQLLFSDSIPVAAGVRAKISGKQATAKYTYADQNPENGSNIKWYRATNASGSGATLVQNGNDKSYDLTDADSGRYLRTCVTPSNGVNDGDQQCGSWTAVGSLLSYYWDASFGGDELSVAYSKSRSGTCFTLGDLESGWNDDASSYKFDTVPGCATTLYMYQHKDCEGAVQTRSFPAGTSGEDIASIASTLGSGWNNAIGSFSVVYCDSVSATDVTFGYDRFKAQGAYTIDSTSLFDTDYSTFNWYLATSSSGAGKTQIGTSSLFDMDESQAGKFLQFCVTPNNGTNTGSKVCSAWTHVPAVVFYWNTDFGGDDLIYPYTQASSGSCHDMGDVKSGWSDDVGSLKVFAPLSTSARLYVYKGTSCSGAEASTYVAAGGSASVAHVGNTYGSGWNNNISSFKVVY